MKNIWKLIAAIAIVGGLAACKKDNTKGLSDLSGGCEAVDLGLSVKWAAYNVGAQNVYGVGFFFAWGETVEKGNYAWEKSGDYKWGIYDDAATPLYGMYKYTGSFANGDGNSVLEPGDDPATRMWGTKWRTPTEQECRDLCTKCTWTWDDARKGFTVEGPSKKSIFIYAGGYYEGSNNVNVGQNCYLWSSSLSDSNASRAFAIYTGSKAMVYTASRFYGHNVRAVTDY